MTCQNCSGDDCGGVCIPLSYSPGDEWRTAKSKRELEFLHLAGLPVDTLKTEDSWRETVEFYGTPERIIQLKEILDEKFSGFEELRRCLLKEPKLVFYNYGDDDLTILHRIRIELKRLNRLLEEIEE